MVNIIWRGKLYPWSTNAYFGNFSLFLNCWWESFHGNKQKTYYGVCERGKTLPKSKVYDLCILVTDSLFGTVAI